MRGDALDYAVYGVLCAAKLETGPEGARRMYRIQERINNWDDAAVAASLIRLMDRGWVRQLEPVLGMIHYEALDIVLAVSSDGGRAGAAAPAIPPGRASSGSRGDRRSNT